MSQLMQLHPVCTSKISTVVRAASCGVYSYIKHFALKEQEYNRQSMICMWSCEQAAREIYLKPFEMSVKLGGATAVMSSYNMRQTIDCPEITKRGCKPPLQCGMKNP